LSLQLAALYKVRRSSVLCCVFIEETPCYGKIRALQLVPYLLRNTTSCGFLAKKRFLPKPSGLVVFRCCEGQSVTVVSCFCCGLFQFSMLVFVALLFAQVVFLDIQVAAKMMNEGRAKIAHTPVK
jgi:hypothetical protein